MSCLVVITGRTKGETFQVSPERDNLVGRLGDCQVCLADARLSRRHCVISAGQTGYTVRDLGSANGVFLNGRRVREAALKEGDRIRIGTTEMEFHLTERFEDAETKRLAAGEKLPPELGLAKPRKARNLDTEALQFCAKCSGSIPAGDLANGRAKTVGGELLCVECLARHNAAADVAASMPGPRRAAPPAKPAQAPPPPAKTTAQPPAAKLGAAPPSGSTEPLVRLADEDDDEFSTDALLLGEGGIEAVVSPAGAAKQAPTVPMETVKPPRGPAKAPAAEEPGLDDDGLPDLPDEKPGAGPDADAATPRPGQGPRGR